MKKNITIISLALIVIIMVWCCIACDFTEVINDLISDTNDAIVDSEVDFEHEMTPLAYSPVIPEILMPVASDSKVDKNEKVLVDYSNTADGYIMVKWLKSTSKQLRVQITGSSDTTYTYTLKPDSTFEVYPLSDGNGSYTVMALEQTEGTRYSVALTVKFSVTLTDEFEPFLRPNQYVNFNQSSQVVVKAAELVANERELTDKISAVYNYLVNNFSYDKQLAQTVQSGYLPDVDAVLARRMGICFDYAAVMAAMLRSQSIPTKLVVGFAGDVYHAWINVYSDETGWINRVIFFDGETWVLMDPTFDSTMKNTSALQDYIGDGSSYLEKYQY